jgi:tRNA G18 (ribose-2'-O)-methylase SpoU
MNKLNSKQLRVSEPTEKDLAKIKRREIYLILDNILDTYNIGSIFRLADAAGVKCIYLCGDCETPPNIKIARAAVGCEKWVEWEYFSTAKEAIESIRYKVLSIKIVAIEQSKKSVDYRKIEYTEPLALVVGHETTGVSKETLKACDVVAEIPMYGINVSLNVMVSLAIVLFKAIE